MAGKSQYSDAELAWLKAHCTLPIREYAAQFSAAFGRLVPPHKLKNLRQYRGWRTGRDGRFKAGHTLSSKRRKRAPGSGGYKFRPGELHGKAARNYKPVGFEKVRRGGYVERKIADEGPRVARWRDVHRIEWEAAHGPVPDGLVLKCKGDRLNTDPSNWALVPKPVMTRLNGGGRRTYVAYGSAPDELKPVIMATAMLEHQARVARGRAGSANVGGQANG